VGKCNIFGCACKGGCRNGACFEDKRIIQGFKALLTTYNDTVALDYNNDGYLESKEIDESQTEELSNPEALSRGPPMFVLGRP